MQPPSSPAGAAAAQPEGRASTIGAGAEQGKAGEMPNLKVPCPGGEAGHPKCVEAAGRGSSAPAKQQRSWVALSTAKAQPWDPPRDTKLAGDMPPSSVGSCEGKKGSTKAAGCAGAGEEHLHRAEERAQRLWGRWRITSPPAPGPLLLTVTHSFRTEAQKGVKKK